MTTLAAELASFPTMNTTPVAGALVSDAEARRLLAAWAAFPLPTWRQPEQPRPDDDRLRWDWLWLGVGYDVAALAHAAGVEPHAAHRAFRTLIALRLIRPDGTISEDASALLFMALEAGATKPARPARGSPKAKK